MFNTIRLKCGLRFKLLAGFTVLLAISILALVLADKCDTYNPLAYILASISWLHRDNIGQPKAVGSLVGDKIVVIPALVTDDMSWVTTELPDWQRAIYIVNPANDTLGVTADLSTSQLTTPMNKGKESMAYLTYIIDNYVSGQIPSTVSFLHSHRRGFFSAWHVDTPLHDNVMAMKLLRLDTVRERGYVNLRCNWNPGCTKRGRNNAHVTRETWMGVMGNTSTPLFNSRLGSPGALPAETEVSDEKDHNKITVWTACCAQFAVSKEAIYARPLEDYVNMRRWLMDTELDDARSGRVFEYLWHVIFGMEATFCPDEDKCYCEVYGRC
jgi:hypothetical protein